MAKELGVPNGLLASTSAVAATTTATSTTGGLTTTLTSATTTTATAAANGNVMNGGLGGGGPKMPAPALVGKTGKLPAPDPGGINAANERVQNYINNLEVDGGR